jgi:hypothetical protein
MNDSKTLLKSILGDRGYETLEKAIFKQKTQAVIDPLEYYLPLIVVPRTIISWLVHNIKPMRPGTILDTKFPGRDDIMVHFEKQGDDQYRAEFVQGGKVIHSFEKQSLPAVSGHLMTVGELYDSFGEEKEPAKIQAEEPKAEHKDDASGLEMVRHMMSMSNCVPAEDPENVKWQMSHANVREMTAVIGKLVDALTAKQMSRNRFESDIDKTAEKEVKDQQGKLSEMPTPEKTNDKHIKALESNPDIKEKGQSYTEVRDLKAKPSEELAINLKPKVVPASEKRVDTPSKETPFKKEDMQIAPVPQSVKVPEGLRVADTPHEEKPFSKESMAPSMQAAKNLSSPRMAGAQQDQHQQKGILQRISGDGMKKDALAPHAPADTSNSHRSPAPVAPNPKLDKCSGYFRKKAELLTKPYVSDAQRRWAHTDTGTKALGGKEAVHHWDESSKGKDLPEHVKKDAMAPSALPKSENDKIGPNTVPVGMGGIANVKKPKDNAMYLPVLKEEMGKSDMPKGAGQPNGPAKAIAPKAPIPPSNAPAQAQAKQGQQQAQTSGTGGYKPPHTPGAVQPKNPAAQKQQVAKSDYFRSKLGKSEQSAIRSVATEQQLYKSECPNCGVPEFIKDKDGNPKFNPCACFLVMQKDEEGKPYKFVQVLKKSDGNFNLAFAKDADPDTVKLFLLTLKSAILIKRKFGVL